MSEILTIPTLSEYFFLCYFIDDSSAIESSQRSTFLLRCTCETSTVDTTAIPSNSLSFSLLSFPLFRTLCLFWEHSNLLLLCTRSSSPPPSPVPSSESGRPRCHHSPPGDNRHKGGLGGPGCGRSRCTATGERVEESPPPLPIPSSPPSSPPPQMMKTLSLRIRKERRASAEGITIKAVPPHLWMSIPLSTYSLFVTLYQFWDSKSFHAPFTLPNCC